MSDNNRRLEGRERRYNIDLDQNAKKQLRFYMNQELSYYNDIVNAVTMRLRAFPDDIIFLKNNYEKLWTAIATTGQNISALLNKKVTDWPTELRNAVPTSNCKDDKLILDSRKTMLFNMAAVPTKVHPHMRGAIAAEVIKTVIPQAEVLSAAQKGATGQLKTPLQMLMPYQYPEKRHVQLSSELVSMHYDSEQNQTEITVPYCSSPLIVRNLDITRGQYNLMIIRQQPNTIVTETSPWTITLVQTTRPYMLDLTDQNPYQRRKRKSA